MLFLYKMGQISDRFIGKVISIEFAFDEDELDSVYKVEGDPNLYKLSNGYFCSVKTPK